MISHIAWIRIRFLRVDPTNKSFYADRIKDVSSSDFTDSHDVMCLSAILTLIGWFPRTTAALLLLSDNHLLVAKPTLATAANSWQMRTL